jgi:hypothetical protein
VFDDDLVVHVDGAVDLPALRPGEAGVGGVELVVADPGVGVAGEVSRAFRLVADPAGERCDGDVGDGDQHDMPGSHLFDFGDELVVLLLEVGGAPYRVGLLPVQVGEVVSAPDQPQPQNAGQRVVGPESDHERADALGTELPRRRQLGGTRVAGAGQGTQGSDRPVVLDQEPARIPGPAGGALGQLFLAPADVLRECVADIPTVDCEIVVEFRLLDGEPARAEAPVALHPPRLGVQRDYQA